ncbi:hypothetical protein GAT45_18775, partial [Salmonella enterica]|nr:hypothetical protein [Salmonella enterica]
SDQSISAWREIIPERAAFKLERITEGSLRYDASLYVGRRQHPAEV